MNYARGEHNDFRINYQDDSLKPQKSIFVLDTRSTYKKLKLVRKNNGNRKPFLNQNEDNGLLNTSPHRHNPHLMFSLCAFYKLERS